MLPFAPRRVYLAALTALALSFTALGVSAQTLNRTRIDRSDPAHTGSNTTDLWISYDDCIRNDTFTMSFDVSNPGNDNLEIWAGTSACGDKTARDGDTDDCRRVGAVRELRRSDEVDVTVQEIIAALNGSGSGREACDAYREKMNEDGLKVHITFMFVGDDRSATVQSDFETTVDMRGPDAPTKLKAGSGESKLVLEWDVESTLDVSSYRFYCDPAPAASADRDNELFADGLAGATGVAGETGVGGSAGLAEPNGEAGETSVDPNAAGGSAGEGASGSKCPTTVLTPGSLPAASLEAYRCGGKTGKSATDGTATGLTNGQVYTVAVVAVDQLGNPSELSNLACQVPELVDDFYERYTAAGGKGGGGICAINRQPAVGAAYALLVAGIGGLIRRRSRRRCSS